MFFIGPEALVDYIGVQNAYGLMFLVAALGGLSTFNSVPYLAVLFVLANTGVNPFWLGTVSALGVMCGDSFSYLLGRSGGAVIPDSFTWVFTNIKQFAIEHPKLYPSFCFVYGAICPLSNDFVTIASGIANISYKKVMIPLALGNIVFNIAFAYVSVYASTWVGGLLG
ncbi:VTT domain-containing protein [Patescibacteria group bacterium]|nr:VTT domain-containing protein [Patescibacteria group bacterium]